MKQSNATPPVLVESEAAKRLNAVGSVHTAYIGLDVHKVSISVAVAEEGRQAPEFLGEIPNEPKAIDRLIRQMSERFAGQSLLFCYEAGPCGYGIYHQIQASGQDGEMVAPSLIPQRPGDRVKTNRRDAILLARLSRSGELTPVWVPTAEQEAIRDLTRAREDMKKAAELRARQRLNNAAVAEGLTQQQSAAVAGGTVAAQLGPNRAIAERRPGR